jgi:hypothetical protein
MFAQQINRITPATPVEKMDSFHILAPLPTHWRRATCAEAGCPKFEHGWAVSADVVTEGDRALFTRRGYRFVQVDGSDGPMLMFEAGQSCFRASEHRIRLDREETFIRRPGDWRVPLQNVERDFGAPPLVFSGADSWADAVHTHLGKFEGIG